MLNDMSQVWKTRINDSQKAARIVAISAISLGSILGLCSGVKLFVKEAHPNDAEIATIAFSVANKRDAAGQFAAEFVGALLSTPQSQRDRTLARFMTLPASSPNEDYLAASDPAPAAIDTPRVWSVVPTGNAGEASLFSVIVMVQQRPYAVAPSKLAYYRVPISIWNFQPRAMDYPAPIDIGAGADIVISYNRSLSSSGPVYSVVSGFLNAYLTSTSGLDRYVVAGAWIKPVGGYQSVAVTSVSTDTDEPAPGSSGARLHVRATVSAQTSQFATIPFTFLLTVENSGGTWMIAAIDLKPQTAADSAAKPAGTPRP